MNGTMKVGSITFENADPDPYIRQVLAEHKSPRLEGLPSFTGGLVGYFSYDYIKYAEPTLRLDAKDTERFKDVDLMLFDKVIAFDNFRQKIILIVKISLEDVDSEYNRARLELDTMERLIRSGEPCAEISGQLKSDFHPIFDQDSYCNMVETAKHHIHEGDIFQIVLSNRLEADFDGSLFNTYRILRTLNPSPYMFYFSSSDMEVAGASPETLVKLENGVLHTFPLAGTRPRGKTEEEDKQLEAELLADPKELAEHNMLVDLGRNDIGKVSRFGTVSVEKYHCIERYSHVMHIGSTVRGEISGDKDALDALSAVLPAGTLSGAPKLMACQLINDLEGNKRGIYGGATVSYAKELMHGKQSDAILTEDCALFEGCPNPVPVARYHSLAAVKDTIPDCLSVIAETADGEIMAVKHKNFPVYGMQFHPESVLTPDGPTMLKNFLNTI